MSGNFLDKARNSNSLISEQRILEYLSKLDKAVIISLDNLEFFSKHLVDIKFKIERVARSDIHHLKIDNNGIKLHETIGKSSINEAQLYNLVDGIFKNYPGYCFVVNAGISYVMLNGIVDEKTNASFMKRKTMQQLLGTKKNVCDLEEVFENFFSACKHHKEYKEYCFSSNGMIKAEIKEQELRNLLMKYLDHNVKGEVQPEFCTDFYNDEESVDIYLNDGTHRAIIEVKFAFKESYYSGNTYYSFSARIGDGMKQLDKYALHLADGRRQVDYGYVYMFYCNDMKADTIRSKVNAKYQELERVLSAEFFSIYKCTVTNDLHCWCH